MTETAMQPPAIRRMLLARRQDMHTDVRGRVREWRTSQPDQGRDHLEVSDAGTQGDLAFALLQMRSESLSRIDAALGRLRSGSYGRCAQCAGAIGAHRLRVLPFAVHCRVCAETLEGGRASASPRGSVSESASS